MSKRRVQPEDILAIRTIGGLEISPGGDRALFAVQSADPENVRTLSHLWILDLKSGAARPWTHGNVTDGSARFSPDGGRIAFTRKVEDSTQLHIMQAEGGESRALTSLPAGSLGGIEWSPDGRRIAFTHRRKPVFEENKMDPKLPVSRHITRLAYKAEGRGYHDGEWSHLWVLDLEGGAVRQLTDGEQDDGPGSWSPDGSRLLYASNHNADERPNDIDLWTVPADGGTPKKLETPAGPAGLARWSPDGRRIAYIGHDSPDQSWGQRNQHVWVVSADGGDAKDVVSGFDRTCQNATVTDTRGAHGEGQPPVWSADGSEIFFLASDWGRAQVYRVASTGGTPAAVTQGAHEMQLFSTDRSGRRTVASVGTWDSPSEVHTLDLETGALEKKSLINDAALAGLELSKPQAFRYKSRDGWEVGGWLLKPPDFDASRKYPLLLEVHGGPRAQYGEGFFHEFQLLAGQGYCVLYTNPRGSQGHGEAHAAAIVGDWGRLDYEDLMAGVDHALEKGFIDAEQMGVLGGSYGGFMTNWIVGHTDRFKAAVTMRCLSNAVSFTGTSDMGHMLRDEFLGVPWDDHEKLWEQSPIRYVKEMRTPLLILHSDGDLRCPFEQAEQLFVALKMLKRDVEMVRFPEENHDLSRGGRPDRRLARLQAILGWFRRHLPTR